MILAGPLEKERWFRIGKLTKESIEKHRATLEALSRWTKPATGVGSDSGAGDQRD